MSKTFRIAAIAGDGIGNEVLPEGLRVVEAAAKKWNLDLSIEIIEWASCDYYERHGQMMPDNWFEQLKGFDAIYFGAVGWPDKGFAAQVPPRLRSICEHSPGAPVPWRAMPAGGA